MAYRALYRIYRPASFNEVAGQDHITDVLRNQVKLGCLSHAYLFCGPRGTGKTTMAKILSKAANCLSPVDGEPCGTCEMCRISANVNADIMEIDAASNNGVDNVRDLIDQAQFAPLQLKKRVFIIDEVHMLSQSAFNALLKTLEEPPEHVLFILATTEPEKLLATVISRCQRFDFKRLTMPDIVAYMEKVLQHENVEAEKDALRIIAHAADGGMRDALSLLNQCISVSGKNLTVRNVREVLGSVAEDLLFELTDSIIKGDGRACLELLENVVRDGKDLGILTKDLSSHIRALLLTSICGKCADLLETTDDCALRYERQAGTVSKERLLYISEELIKTRTSIRYFSNPRLLLETSLIRMCCPQEERSEEALLSRIAFLEDRLKAISSSGCAVLPQIEKDVATSVNTSAITDQSPAPSSLPENSNEAENNIQANENRLIDNEMPNPLSTSVMRATDTVSSAYIDSGYSEKNVSKSDPNSEEIYDRFKSALMKINALSSMALSSLTGKQVTDDRLILFYDPTNQGSAILLLKQPLLGQLQEAADQVRPGLKVILQEKNSDQLSDSDARLQELFGDKLTFEI